MLEFLPVKQELETKEILKKSISANRALAILNETAKSVPNRFILINALTLQEAKDSSEIENIITTHDELYKADLDLKSATKEAKEVKGYQSALLQGVDLINNGILSINDIVKIQGILENNDAGIRTQVGTKLKNDKTGEVIYEPPQDYQEIIKLFNNLESYINEKNDLDSLINMAIIHYQFEAIHPFYDGNGRTGRIINILYLMLNDLLDLPVLYLSGYIINNKAKYYQLLREVDAKDNWQGWILYMLNGLEQTATQTTLLINDITNLMGKTKKIIKEKLPKIYSKDLIEILFRHPYTKIDFLVEDLSITRQTASKHLQEIEKLGVLRNIKVKNSNFYINIELLERLIKTS
jgi:Fic family protein